MMEPRIIKVTGKGQISLPMHIRKYLKIQKGDKLMVVENGNKIVLKKIENDEFKDILKISEVSLKEVWDNQEDEIWNEYLK